jgi:monoamine oxidase
MKAQAEVATHGGNASETELKERLEATAEAEAIAAHRLASRRRFLGEAGTICGGFLVAGGLAGSARGYSGKATASGAMKRSSNRQRTLGDVAIVGAGIAGLLAAYRLHQADVQATVYEGDTRIGGRLWTVRGFFDQDQLCEAHAEFIDSYHHTMIRVATEMGLELEDLTDMPPGLREIFYIDGAEYPLYQLARDLIPVIIAATRDRVRAGSDTTFYHSNAYGRSLDHMSAHEWLETRVPGGNQSRCAQAISIHTMNEYGVETWELSALNMVYEFAATAAETGRSARARSGLPGRAGGQRNQEGNFWSVYHIKGGNDLLPLRLAAELESGQIKMEHRLLAAASDGGRVRMTFATPGGTIERSCDQLVLALPFHALRGVDLSALEMREEKRQAIANLAIAKNSKLVMQFTDRHWRSFGASGDIWADRDFQATWDSSTVQPGEMGLLTNYLGGDYGADFIEGTPEERARLFLQDVEPILPGLRYKWTGRVFRSYPLGSPLLRGSYPAYGLGQFTSIRGLEPEAEGNVHFAGDHTSMRFQGFIEGAAESGERVANELLRGARARAGR